MNICNTIVLDFPRKETNKLFTVFNVTGRVAKWIRHPTSEREVEGLSPFVVAESLFIIYLEYPMFLY